MSKKVHLDVVAKYKLKTNSTTDHVVLEIIVLDLFVRFPDVVNVLLFMLAD